MNWVRKNAPKVNLPINFHVYIIIFENKIYINSIARWLDRQIQIDGASQGALVVKNPPANAVDTIPGSEDPLVEGMAIHSSSLAWRIPWTEELGRLQSTQCLQESDMT